MITPCIRVSQQIVTLCFHLCLFGLADTCLTIAQCNYVSFGTGIIYLNDRSELAAIVRSIIHREHSLELEMFQEIPFSIYVPRTTIVLGTCCVGFQVNVYHWIIHLCLLEFRQSCIKAVLVIEYRSYRSSANSSGYSLSVGW